MRYLKTSNYLFVVFFLLLQSSAFGQTAKQEKMEQLSFMIGEWIGTSTVYENGVATKEGSAYEKITYDLDKSILVIELNTVFLQLHTIIYFDEKDQTYYYYPFSKRGVNRYPAEFNDGKLTVRPNEENRFIFTRTAEGGFREYGEKLINGQWTKSFEDNFKNTQ